MRTMLGLQAQEVAGMKPTKKDVEMYRDAEFLKHLCDSWQAQRQMLEEFRLRKYTDGTAGVYCVSCGGDGQCYPDCKLKELLV